MTPTASRRRTALVVLVAGALVLGACSKSKDGAEPTTTTRASTTTRPSSTSTTAGSTTTTTTPAVSTLTWTECDGGFECSSLEVPVDHRNPRGPKLTLGLARRPARNPAERIGSLLMNPGGPGGSAVELIQSIPLPTELTDRFDIVGFDPRGVGRSSALDCGTHLQAIYNADPTMEDDADRQAFLEASQAFVDECGQKYPDLLPHLGTADVARDMDLVRAALGEDKISYVGYSYGTSIGQQYARLFPTRIRAMVLDGVVDPAQSGIAGAAGQANGFSQALDAFIAECDRGTCGLDQPAGAVIDEVIAASEKQPIPANRSDRPATPGVVSLALAQALYTEELWPQLARALSQAQTGNGNGLVQLADAYLQRRPDGSYPFGFEIYFAVSCLDSTWPRDPQVVFDAAKGIGIAYPRLGEGLVNDYIRCALWPVPPNPLTAVPSTMKGLPPIVVISTTGDPATPYASGLRIAQQIPDARLVTNVGEGHTIYAQGKACVDDPVTTYLIDLTAPEDGLWCA